MKERTYPRHKETGTHAPTRAKPRVRTLRHVHERTPEHAHTRARAHAHTCTRTCTGVNVRTHPYGGTRG